MCVMPGKLKLPSVFKAAARLGWLLGQLTPLAYTLTQLRKTTNSIVAAAGAPTALVATPATITQPLLHQRRDHLGAKQPPANGRRGCVVPVLLQDYPGTTPTLPQHDTALLTVKTLSKHNPAQQAETSSSLVAAYRQVINIRGSKAAQLDAGKHTHDGESSYKQRDRNWML
jgi:hypothetical protein